MSQHPEAAQPLVDFEPTKKYFVGIDSDGCAMDAMDIKHQECFTPCYIKYWDLQPISTLARQTALFVNLYSVTRGLNRWLALKQLLDLLRDRVEVAERGVTIPPYPELGEFTQAPGYPLSDKGIAAYYEDHPSDTIARAIRWGNGVNEAIADMVHGAGPFPGVREALIALQDEVDCMVVSATPLHALTYEWNAHDIAKYMKMIGDAPGDRDAAAKAQCLHYPILPGEEKRSWQRFKDEALQKFLEGSYAGEYQQMLIDEFNAKLPDEVPWETISGNRKIVMPKVK